MSSDVDKVYLWNPIGFNPQDHLNSSLGRYADHARYFVHCIHLGLVYGFARDGFVPLKAAYLRRFFPNRDDYLRVKKNLIKSKVVVTDRYYIVGEKSYGYRLGSKWVDVEHDKIAVTDQLLARKILRHRESRKSLNLIRIGDFASAIGLEWADETPSEVHLHLCRNLERIEISLDDALQWLDSRGIPYSVRKTAVRLIRYKDWSFIVDSYGRCHTNLTNLLRGLRGFLSYHGQQLVNLDIRNSQPLFFAVILKERYGDQMPADVRLYIELCEKGQFYDFLMERSGVPSKERGIYKGRFFGYVFYCKNRPETDAAKDFGRLFPSVYATIREMKDADHADFSKAMQRRESDLMIGQVAARVMRELPDAFIATIHDSILTTPEHTQAMRAILLDEFGKIGLRPTINVEQLVRPSEPPPDPKQESKRKRRRSGGSKKKPGRIDVHKKTRKH